MNILTARSRLAALVSLLIVLPIALVHAGPTFAKTSAGFDDPRTNPASQPLGALAMLGLSVDPVVVTLDPTSGQTCAHSSVSGPRLSLQSVSIDWTGSAPLDEATIIVAFQHANIRGGQYICMVDGNEFDAVFGTENAAVKKSLKSLAGCSLQCGGIELLRPQEAFRATGTVTVVGLTQIGSVGRTQQQASAPISINFKP